MCDLQSKHRQQSASSCTGRRPAGAAVSWVRLQLACQLLLLHARPPAPSCVLHCVQVHAADGAERHQSPLQGGRPLLLSPAGHAPAAWLLARRLLAGHYHTLRHCSPRFLQAYPAIQDAGKATELDIMIANEVAAHAGLQAGKGSPRIAGLLGGFQAPEPQGRSQGSSVQQVSQTLTKPWCSSATHMCGLPPLLYSHAGRRVPLRQGIARQHTLLVHQDVGGRLLWAL